MKRVAGSARAERRALPLWIRFQSSFSFFLHEGGPVAVSFGQIALGVFVEIVANAFAVLEQQPAIHNLKRLYVDLDQFVPRDTVGAIAPKGRFIFRRIGLERV